ncbi:MAG TPA: hypothetical protein VFB63_31205 [Bryobacteraceae bacterium]|nr:hypothetical protein [Bryobacteraceae bacterium]
MLEKILQDVQGLSNEERKQLAAMLRGANGSYPDGHSEQEFEQRLAAEGFLSIPAPAGSAPLRLGPPLQIRGRPLSQILIEERR